MPHTTLSHELTLLALTSPQLSQEEIDINIIELALKYNVSATWLERRYDQRRRSIEDIDRRRRSVLALDTFITLTGNKEIEA